MGPADCDSGATLTTPLFLSLCWEAKPAASDDKRFGEWKQFYVWTACLMHSNPDEAFHNAIIDLRVSGRLFYYTNVQSFRL